MLGFSSVEEYEQAHLPRVQREKLAKEVDADLILATDPDADRLGVYAKDTKTGEYMSFTGNMSGMLIAEYILREKTKTNTMTKTKTTPPDRRIGAQARESTEGENVF